MQESAVGISSRHVKRGIVVTNHGGSEICHGKPCVRGLRYPVEFLLELLSGDMTNEQILADYPDLEADDLKAACAYGARLSQIKRIEPLAA